MKENKKIILVTAVLTASITIALNHFLNKNETPSNVLVLQDHKENYCQSDYLSSLDENLIIFEKTVVLGKASLTLESLKKQNYIANDYMLNKRGIPSLKELNELSSIYNIPENLLYSLMLKESGGDILAQSGKGAKGLFQFLLDTAIEFGLTINEDIDERSNPWKAADASARYLAWIFTYLHNDVSRSELNNYKYVLAAYNAGIGNVKTENGLSIPNFKETINYVNLILGHAKGDLYLVKRGDILKNIAKNSKLHYSELKVMNDNIEQENLIAGSYLMINKNNFKPHHVVNKGESLYSISKRYSVNVGELIALNNIDNNLIGIGQKIRIPF